jgi:membrane associated rhomboid family serine protease
MEATPPRLGMRLDARVRRWLAVPVTTGVFVAYLAVFVATLLLPREATLRFLVPDSFDIWRGNLLQIWTLLFANFVHLQGWHVALNLAALCTLAPAVEWAVGSLRFAGLLVGSGLVASGAQLALFGNIGVGGSGALYGLFGSAWASRRIYPQLREVLTLNRSAAWVGWFLACWLAPALHVANGAHLGGLVFGIVAGAVVARSSRFLPRALPAATVALAIAAGSLSTVASGLVGCHGHRDHKAGAYRDAIEAYTMSLQLDPSQSWVRANLVHLLARARRFKQARDALDELRHQDPETATRVVEELEHKGAAAWAH